MYIWIDTLCRFRDALKWKQGTQQIVNVNMILLCYSAPNPSHFLTTHGQLHFLNSYFSVDTYPHPYFLFLGVLFALKVLSNHYYPGGMTYVMGLPISNRYASWVELVLIHITSPG